MAGFVPRDAFASALANHAPQSYTVLYVESNVGKWVKDVYIWPTIADSIWSDTKSHIHLVCLDPGQARWNTHFRPSRGECTLRKHANMFATTATQGRNFHLRFPRRRQDVPMVLSSVLNRQPLFVEGIVVINNFHETCVWWREYSGATSAEVALWSVKWELDPAGGVAEKVIWADMLTVLQGWLVAHLAVGWDLSY